MPDILDLGCGTRKMPGAIGVDVNPVCEPDVVHDLESFPYPFDDGSFDEVHLDNVIEHLSDVLGTMEEIHRICRDGALVRIVVPYFRSRWADIDPTHKHAFTVDSFTYFDPDHVHSQIYPYSPARFRLERLVFDEGLDVGPFKRFVAWIGNRQPVRYEYHLSHRWPLNTLTFYLRAVK